jgi:23S rRNA (pseudouridine1915-N3)-methyltransferase
VKIHLIAVGTRMPDWVQSAYADYAARLPRECRLELREIAAGERGKNADIERLKREEGERVLKALPRGAQAIALDERGEALDSTGWAQALARWRQSGNDMALLIGGPDGHAPEVLARSTTRWSLSRLTLPHPLVRVVVAEQLYRASSILANHPYHRG